MAIQVNGTTVIDNSRALTNITSVDATTVAALGAAGVGGAAIADWQDLSNSYNFSFTNTVSGYDTGMLNISTILSGLPSSWKYLAIIQKATMTSPTGTGYYSSTVGTHSFRLGSSSSSYTEIASSNFDMAFQNFFFSPNYSSSPSVANLRDTHYGWLVYADDQFSGGPSEIFQPALFENPNITTITDKKYATNIRATNTGTYKDHFADQLLPEPAGLTTETDNWNSSIISSGEGPIQYTGSYANIGYLGYRFQAAGYSSSDGSAPSFSVTMKASYST